MTERLGIGYRADMALEWRPAGMQPDVPPEQVLRSVITLEELSGASEDALAAGTQHEAGRLEFKLDLLLDLVGALLEQAVTQPPRQAVELRVTGLRILQPDWQPEPGAKGALALYIHPNYPRPLVLPARIAQVDASAIQFEFGELDENTRTLLERFIFIHHRRAVAQQHRPPAP